MQYTQLLLRQQKERMGSMDQRDSTSIVIHYLMIFCVIGIFYFPYRSGKRFFKPYATKTAKFKSFFVATFQFLLGLFLDFFAIGMLVSGLKDKPEHNVDMDKMLITVACFFLIMFGIGAISGYLAKREARELSELG